LTPTSPLLSKIPSSSLFSFSSPLLFSSHHHHTPATYQREKQGKNPKTPILTCPFFAIQLRYFACLGCIDVSAPSVIKAVEKKVSVGIVLDGIAGIFRCNEEDEVVNIKSKKVVFDIFLLFSSSFLPVLSFSNFLPFQPSFQRRPRPRPHLILPSSYYRGLNPPPLVTHHPPLFSTTNPSLLSPSKPASPSRAWPSSHSRPGPPLSLHTLSATRRSSRQDSTGMESWRDCLEASKQASSSSWVASTYPSRYAPMSHSYSGSQSWFRSQRTPPSCDMN